MIENTSLPTLNLRELRSLAISEAMRRCNGNHTEAAKLLGVSTKTLQRRHDKKSGTIKPYGKRSTIT